MDKQEEQCSRQYTLIEKTSFTLIENKTLIENNIIKAFFTCFCYMAYLSFHRLLNLVHNTIVINDQPYPFYKQFTLIDTSIFYSLVKITIA